MTEVITTDRMLQVLEQVVEEAGEGYVYKKGTVASGVGRCSYVDEEGGCIIGRALTKLGVSEPTLRAMDELQRSDITSVLVTWSSGIDGLTFTAGTQRLMRVVQRKQDLGTPWGTCLREARALLELVGNEL